MFGTVDARVTSAETQKVLTAEIAQVNASFGKHYDVKKTTQATKEVHKFKSKFAKAVNELQQNVPAAVRTDDTTGNKLQMVSNAFDAAQSNINVSSDVRDVFKVVVYIPIEDLKISDFLETEEFYGKSIDWLAKKMTLPTH